MEPDCAFYVGERAIGYLAALVGGEEAADAYIERTAPDLVVEVELTSADVGKAERYGEMMGVRELARLPSPSEREGLPTVREGARRHVPEPAAPSPVPPSLAAACTEYDRWRSRASPWTWVSG